MNCPDWYCVALKQRLDKNLLVYISFEVERFVREYEIFDFYILSVSDKYQIRFIMWV